MPRKPRHSCPTASRNEAQGALANLTSAEVEFLVGVAALRGVVGLLKDLEEAVDWLRETRIALRRIEDPPRLAAEVLRGDWFLIPDRVAQLPDEHRLLVPALEGARRLARSVVAAREELAVTGSLVALWGSRTRNVFRFDELEVVAALWLAAAHASLSPKLTATEAAALAVIAEAEPLTDDFEQRRNTWSKRIRRVSSRLKTPWLDALAAFLRAFEFVPKA